MILEERRNLVTERFAAAGRHHHQRIAPLERGRHRFLLQGAERVVTPVFRDELEEAGGHWWKLYETPQVVEGAWVRGREGSGVLSAAYPRAHAPAYPHHIQSPADALDPCDRPARPRVARDCRPPHAPENGPRLRRLRRAGGVARRRSCSGLDRRRRRDGTTAEESARDDGQQSRLAGRSRGDRTKRRARPGPAEFHR